MEMTDKNQWKLLPKGMFNFTDVVTQNYYYVDKTRFIPLLEREDRFIFFIRPRRFGKSLLLDMLTKYYDVYTKSSYSSLFNNLYVGAHPTELRNSYLVLFLDFSGIEGNSGSYKESLDAYCSIVFRSFCEYYADLLPKGTLEGLNQYTGATAQLEYVCDRCKTSGQRIYLFIDEYDHFTNDILSNPSRLTDYENETHGEGALRKFFNVIKLNTRTVIQRCFVTGVSPVTMDDLTSGFNIATNYSTAPVFNALVGFTEEEVRTMLHYYEETTGVFKHTVDELIHIMAPYYDHYCFAKSLYGKETLYNSNMVLYFVNNYIRSHGEIPEDMIDENIRVDYNKLRMLMRKDRSVAAEQSTIQTIVKQGYIIGEVKKYFPAYNIGDANNFVSLLFYFGMLTYGGLNDEDDTILRIPNQVIREQMYAYLLKIYSDEGLKDGAEERQRLIKRMAMGKDFHAVFENISNGLKTYASVRDLMKGESFIHGFCLSALADTHCFMSESESDAVNGYPDLLLIARKEVNSKWQHSYLIELKYAKKGAGNEVERLRQEGIAQLHRYAESPKIKDRLQGTTLHLIIAIFQGAELAVCEESIEQ
jgi:hypothetical protein